jgi:hypothetical protein
MKKAPVVEVGIAISCTCVQFLESSVSNALVDIKADLVGLHGFMRIAGVAAVVEIVEEEVTVAAAVAGGGMMIEEAVETIITTVAVVDTMIDAVVEVVVEIEMILLRGERVSRSGMHNLVSLLPLPLLLPQLLFSIITEELLLLLPLQPQRMVVLQRLHISNNNSMEVVQVPVVVLIIEIVEEGGDEATMPVAVEPILSPLLA